MGVGLSDGSYHDSEFDMLAATSGVQPQGGALRSEATQVPPAENNASTGNVGQTRGIVDKVLGTTGERYQTWPEKMVRSAVSGVTLPGDVFQGKVDPSSTQAIERSFDLAGLMVGGPAPIAAKAADGTLGSFMGVKSQTINKTNLYKAQEMDWAMAHPDDIFQQTGTFKGVDGRWRQEIPDQGMELNSKAFKEVLSPRMGEPTQVIPTQEGFGTRLPEALNHPELFKAYPHLNNIEVRPMPLDLQSKNMAHFAPSEDAIYMSPMEPEIARQVLMHEVQHSIQKHEGFARGGNESMFKTPELAKAEQNFHSVREKTINELKDHGVALQDINALKYIAGLDEPLRKEFLKQRPEWAKVVKDKSDVYSRIKDIAESEKLLKKAAEDRYEKYLRLAGEVESRNVEARMLNDPKYNKMTHPSVTEDKPRMVQEIR